MARSILAILAGWASVGVFVVLTDLLLMKVFPHDYVPGRMPPDSLSAVSLATSTVFSILGGWVTARLAASRPWRHLLALAVWGELMAVASMVVSWGQIQPWYQIGLAILWLPAVAIGGWLRAGKPDFSAKS